MQPYKAIWSVEDDLLSLFTDTITLSPTQRKVADQILASANKGEVCLLEAGPGMGKTSILRWLHARLGGVMLAARQWATSFNRPASPLLIDDLHLVTPTLEVRAALSERSNLVLSLTNAEAAGSIRRKALKFAIKAFRPADYKRICRRYLGDATERLDMAEIHRAAPTLNGYQLKNACLCLGLRYAAPTTGAFLRCL
jgi:hypothetical protein